MKFSEVIKALEENPNKKFEKFQKYGNRYVISARDNNYFQFDVFNEEGELLDSGCGGGGFSGNFKATDEDWQEVKQSVTWQEALIAWANGASIHCQVDGKTWTYCEGGLEAIEDSNALEEEEILRGKWFIEED